MWFSKICQIVQYTQNTQFDNYSNLENKSKKEPGKELTFFEDGVKFNREREFPCRAHGNSNSFNPQILRD